jgi:hypothetical protein
MPQPKRAPPPPAPCCADHAPQIISAMPAPVSSNPGSSARRRSPAGRPSSIIQTGIVPMMRLGTSVPAAAMPKASSR